MEYYGEHILGIITPFLAVSAFLIPLLSLVIKRKGFYNAYASVVSFIAMVFSFLVFADVYTSGKPIVYAYGGWPPPIGIAYEADAFNALIGAYTSFALFFVVLFSVWYSKVIDDVVWYYTLLLGLETGVLGCVYTGDVFNLFVMLEVLSISAYALVAYYRNRPISIEAAAKYAILGAVVTTCYFISLVFIYGSYGTLNMADLAFKASKGMQAVVVSNGLYGNIVTASLIALVLALWAFTFKSALFPNHFWLPDAYSGSPIPIAAAFSSAVEIVGVYMVVRFLYTIFGVNSVIAASGFRDIIMTVLLVLGILSGIVGALLMITQNNVNRLLGYSTISHIGLLYMALALGLSGMPKDIIALGLVALLFHVINHGIGKLLMFMGVGVAVATTGTRDLNKLSGIGRLYPIASIAIIAAAFHLMGLIPFGGFFSKLLIYQAYISAELLIPAIMVIIISAISVLGYVKIMYSIVFAPIEKEYKQLNTLGIDILMTLLIVACIILGILSPWIASKLSIVINNSLMPAGVDKYLQSFFNTFYKLIPG